MTEEKRDVMSLRRMIHPSNVEVVEWVLKSRSNNKTEAISKSLKDVVSLML